MRVSNLAADVFSGTGCLQELNQDLTGVKTDGVNTILFQRDSTETGLLEGSRAIKYKGKYYLLMVSWPINAPRREVCYRSDKITGPYEKKVILESTFGGFPYLGQGTIVDDARGHWYGMIFQDRGAVGRVLHLLPCRWIDGWPILGDEKGNVPGLMPLPVEGCKSQSLVVSDDFNREKLKINWQWNHNPIDSAWSLTDHRGNLRLKTSRIVDNIFAAPNTISQRMEGPQCSAVVAMDISHVMEGDYAGFAAFNGDSGLLTVTKQGNCWYLIMQTSTVNLSDKDKKIESVETLDKGRVKIFVKKIYLRIDADFRPGQDIATFYYSTDKKTWNKIGVDFKMKYDFQRLFMGTRFAIFNYTTRNTGGYIDIDFFKYKK
jgi:beta-xylosidase